MLRKAHWKISDEHIRKGFSNITKNTGLLGRWQVLSTSPLTVADVAHNEDGILYVLKQLEQIPHKNLHFVLGVVGDKDVGRVLTLLPKNATYYFCKADIPRGLDAQDLKVQASKFSLVGNVFASVKEAFEHAKTNASTDDLVFIGGSVFTVAEVL